VIVPKTLSKDQRNQLARVTLEAREKAEQAARAAVENLAVHEKDYRPHLTVEQRLLRNRLRARGRALGDTFDQAKGTQTIDHLVADAAYEHWHRLLFTRFLAENHLLHTDETHGTVPVTLAECDELAPELGARDGFDLACRFASRTLPGVFRTDDPVLDLTLALDGQVELRRLVNSLPAETFTADDSLGWTYQFWQAKQKDEVNKSGKKIGADELPAVTQLFTEDYMVEFLLHNTLGAWWAGKLGPIAAATEEEARAKAALPPKGGLPGIIWTYLRFIQDEKTRTWSPAAGTFDGWPKHAAMVTFLDPCMGSGHFVVFALPILARLRSEEEGLSAAAAVFAVLHDNLHGLEIDPRCTQIGAFNVALAAWRLGGWQKLPSLHFACSGLAPQAKLGDWLKLAGGNDKLRRGMERLFKLFELAPVLGSLINPHVGGETLTEASLDELRPLLERAMADENADDVSRELAVTARGVAKAAEVLLGQFILVATNVPYLGRGKQEDDLKDYCDRVHPDSKADLATCFIERCLSACSLGGSTALVTPQTWLFLSSYKKLRHKLLVTSKWNGLSILGPGAFGQIGGEVVNVSLSLLTHHSPVTGDSFFGIDVTDSLGGDDKALSLKSLGVETTKQLALLESHEYRISLGITPKGTRLVKYGTSYNGIVTGDSLRFIRCFWEMSKEAEGWMWQQTAVSKAMMYGGRSYTMRWDGEDGEFLTFIRDRLGGNTGAWIRGLEAWGKRGVLVTGMQALPATLYEGVAFDNNGTVIVPRDRRLLPALWAYCSSEEYSKEVRKLNRKISVTDDSFVQVPFDHSIWERAAASQYPHGLSKPHSDDPTQWLFNGHPNCSEQTLQVAVARLLGYRWPRQTGSSFPDCPALGPDGLEDHADKDGIVCLPPIHKEQPGAARLRSLLAAALGKYDERALLAAAGAKKTTIEEWFRDEFFEQHCDLFHQRPFIWHVWDGRKDGFHALVNYHKLDHATLQKLTYAYLGDWIRQQDEDAKADKPGAADRLGAARGFQTELAKILEGEAPYDIFVRWKSLKEQPIGWHPDLNDGVRLNIRPFLMAEDVGKKGAGILRAKPNIKWEKDRGKEPERDKKDFPWFWCEAEPDTDPTPGKSFAGHRWNNVHLTLACKRAARG
jgi:hypothetical protein